MRIYMVIGHLHWRWHIDIRWRYVTTQLPECFASILILLNRIGIGYPNFLVLWSWRRFELLTCGSPFLWWPLGAVRKAFSGEQAADIDFSILLYLSIFTIFFYIFCILPYPSISFYILQYPSIFTIFFYIIGGVEYMYWPHENKRFKG